MSQEGTAPPSAPAAAPPEGARAFVQELVRTVRTWRLYGPGHAGLDGALTQVCRLGDRAAASAPVALRLTGTEVVCGDEVLHESDSPGDALPCRLFDHGVVGLEFEAGMPVEEARELVRLLAAADLDPAADYPTLLWEADLAHVRVLLDALDEEEDDSWKTPAGFAEQLARMGGDDDPPAGDDYAAERGELAERGPVDPLEDARLRFDEHETVQLGLLLADDGYARTVRHAARVVHAMAAEDLEPRSVTALEKTVAMVAEALCAAGDLAGARETLDRAERMVASGHAVAIQLGTRTLGGFRRPEAIARMLDALERSDAVEAEPLRDYLAHVGGEAAEPVAAWLPRTRHPVAVLDALRVLGEAAVRALLPVYETAEGEARARIRAALLELATPDALVALAPEFPDLDTRGRLRFLRLVERSTEPPLRRLVLSALEDGAAEVRRAAVAAVRRTDAPLLAPVLRAMLDVKLFESADPDEVDGFFAMLERVGDASVARVLTEPCLPRGLARSFRKPDAFQLRCLRTLQRMRSPAGRAVADELARTGPRSVRDALEDLRAAGDLES